MDPDATLARIREIVGALTNSSCGSSAREAELGNELAELVEALDSWIIKGGHLPTGWKAGVMLGAFKAFADREPG